MTRGVVNGSKLVYIIGCISFLFLELNADAFEDIPNLFKRPAIQNIVASPSHFTIGALPYGSSQDRRFQEILILTYPPGVSITFIDLSQAQGVTLFDEQSKSGQSILTFQVDLFKFIKDQPYGIFVKKVIRLETDSSTSPQLLIPVTGWLSINESKRDFNDYLFRGSRRWEGTWATPNQAGAVLASFVVLAMGLCSWLLMVKPFPWLRFIGVFILGIGTLLGSVLLALTYSRGGWLAFGIGCALLSLRSGNVRKIALGALIFFVAALLFLPSGMQRVGTYAQFEGDKSVGNRLKLWIGACQIMAEHPLQGVGVDQYGETFSRDYQTFSHTEDNSTAVSDYFTVGAERGLLVLGAVSGVLFFIAGKSFDFASRRDHVLFLTLSVVLITVLVSSLFSTLWFVRSYQWLFFGSLLGLIGYLLFIGVRNNESSLLLQAKEVCCWSLGSLLFWGLASLASLHLLPTKSSMLILSTMSGNQTTCRVYEPRKAPPKGTIIYFAQQDEDVTELCHSTLRPLAELGWRVVWPQDAGDETASAIVDSLGKRYGTSRLFLAGEREGGALCWKLCHDAPLGNHIPEAGAGYGFLSLDLDKPSETKAPPCPFLVFQSIYDLQNSANPAILAQRGEAFRQNSMNIVLDNGEVRHFSSDWMHWLHAVDAYFSKI